MAPEQQIGGDVGRAADLYSLGVVLDEMLQSQDLAETDIAELAKKLRAEEPSERPTNVVSLLQELAAK